MLSDNGEPQVPKTGPIVLGGQKTTTSTAGNTDPDSAEREVRAEPKRRLPPKRNSPPRQKSPNFDTDSLPSTSSTDSIPPLILGQPRQVLNPPDADPALWTSADLSKRLSKSSGALDAFSEQSDTDERVKPPFSRRSSRRRQPVDQELEEELAALETEEDDIELTGNGETTLVASDPTAKTPKDDKAWKMLREKIMAEAKAMGFDPKLTDSNQTIRVLDGAGKEAMLVERQLDKTLKLSYTLPTTATTEDLIRLFLISGSKTCDLTKAESAEVAAKIYKTLTKANVKVTMTANVLQQLSDSKDPAHQQIAEEYSKKNPSAPKPTGTPREIPPVKPTSTPNTPGATGPTTPDGIPDATENKAARKKHRPG